MRWPENARKMIEHYGLPDEIPGVFASSDKLLAKVLQYSPLTETPVTLSHYTYNDSFSSK